MSKIVLPNGSIFHEGGVSPEDEHKFYSGTVKSVLRQEEKDRRSTPQPEKGRPSGNPK
jgi:hypothetical protein